MFQCLTCTFHSWMVYRSIKMRKGKKDHMSMMMMIQYMPSQKMNYSTRYFLAISFYCLKFCHWFWHFFTLFVFQLSSWSFSFPLHNQRVVDNEVCSFLANYNDSPAVSFFISSDIDHIYLVSTRKELFEIFHWLWLRYFVLLNFLFSFLIFVGVFWF